MVAVVYRLHTRLWISESRFESGQLPLFVRVTEWLGDGLQNRIREFESHHGLYDTENYLPNMENT